MHPLINIGIKAARTAGTTIMRALEQLDTIKVHEKGDNDFVTDVDRRAEQQIVQIIQKAYPQHAILGEESGNIAAATPSYDDTVWVIDPIDGTNNFIHGYPHFCVSIAVMQRQQLMHAIIYDPTRNDLFVASRGDGARCNDRRIRVTHRKNLENTILAQGFCAKLDGVSSKNYQQQGIEFSVAGAHLRRTGSSALDLAYVAAGYVDGLWQAGLKPWDMAAGVLLIKEAGGIVIDFDGGENYMESGNIVAANPKLLKPMMQILHS